MPGRSPKQQPVLILIFGHGNPETYGVAIGGKGDPDVAPRLDIKSLRPAIGRTANVTLLMTSCFSGGWVVQTDRMTSKPVLNATLMTAAGPEDSSESWPKSESSGRAGGSIFVTALLRSAIKQQTQEAGDETEDEITESSAYLGWAKLIFDTGREEVDKWFDIHNVKFAAQDDAWDKEWKARSGIPMTDYKGKWEMLRSIPIDISNPLLNRAPNTNSSPTENLGDLSIGESGSIHQGMGFQGSFSNIVREQAWQYLHSFPGNSALGTNSHHSTFERLVKGKDFDYNNHEHLKYLSNVLLYRNDMMKWVTNCKNYLDLTIDDAHLFDSWGWQQQFWSSKDYKSQMDVYEKIFKAVADARIVDYPTREQGWFFTKPRDYLTIAFYESGRTKAQIMADIENLVNCELFSFPAGDNN